MWTFVLHVEILAIVFLHSFSGSSHFYKLFIMAKECHDSLSQISTANTERKWSFDYYTLLSANQRRIVDTLPNLSGK